MQQVPVFTVTDRTEDTLLHEEKLDEICARLGISPKTFLDRPAEKTGRSLSMTRNARKLLRSRQLKPAVFHQPYEAGCETKLNSTHW